MSDTIGQLIAWGVQALSAMENPQLEAHILLAHALDCDRAVLITWPERIVPEDIAANYKALIQRRTHHEPIAYITGTKEFWSQSFIVTPDTLIPRPETELLVQLALDVLPPSPITVLDLGTGSGVIGCALSLERPQWNIIASDLSWEALQVAQTNAKNIGAKVQFIQADALAGFAEHSIDAIVSNPPYISFEDPHLVEGDLPFEPRSALVAGQDGLECYRKIITQAAGVLKKGGWIAFEHGFEQAEAIRGLFEEFGFTHIQNLTDLAGHPRVTFAVIKV